MENQAKNTVTNVNKTFIRKAGIKITNKHVVVNCLWGSAYIYKQS